MRNRFILTLFVSLVFSFIYLLSGRSVESAQSASLSLQPGAISKKVGETFDLNIYLNTGGATVVGAGVTISFDPSKLEVTDADKSTPDVQLKPGSIIPDPTVLDNRVDNTKGKIHLSIGSLTNSFSGEGVLGTINFRAKSPSASTPISFEPSPATKVPSTEVTDVLGKLNNSSVTIASLDGKVPAQDKETQKNGSSPKDARSSGAQTSKILPYAVIGFSILFITIGTVIIVAKSGLIEKIKHGS